MSPRVGACGPVPGWLVSHFLSFVSQFFSFVSQFFSFVSQAGCLWSGSRPACLPPPFIYLPVLFICLPRRLVSHFLECVSHFFSFASQAGCLWPGSCLRGPSLLVPCSISIHLSFRSVTGGVRPCPLAMKIHLSPMRLLSFCLSGLVPALLFSAA